MNQQAMNRLPSVLFLLKILEAFTTIDCFQLLVTLSSLSVFSFLVHPTSLSTLFESLNRCPADLLMPVCSAFYSHVSLLTLDTFSEQAHKLPVTSTTSQQSTLNVDLSIDKRKPPKLQGTK